MRKKPIINNLLSGAHKNISSKGKRAPDKEWKLENNNMMLFLGLLLFSISISSFSRSSGYYLLFSFWRSGATGYWLLHFGHLFLLTGWTQITNDSLLVSWRLSKRGPQTRNQRRKFIICQIEVEPLDIKFISFPSFVK